jgi:hypothetical protein
MIWRLIITLYRSTSTAAHHSNRFISASLFIIKLFLGGIFANNCVYGHRSSSRLVEWDHVSRGIDLRHQQTDNLVFHFELLNGTAGTYVLT